MTILQDADDDNVSTTSSVLTEIDQSEFPNYFVERDGRLFPSHGCPYPLPVDGHEQVRLNKLHEILKDVIGGNFVGPVQQTLGGPRPRALDLCTGTGRWVMDMALQFPNTKFTGFDIVPIMTRHPPPNVDFEMHDVTEPFRFSSSSIDLIHARQIGYCFEPDKYRNLIYEAARLLRPGGLLLLLEWQLCPSIPSAGIAKFYEAWADALSTRGIQGMTAHIPWIVAQTNAFHPIHTEDFDIPLGDWTVDPRRHIISSQFREVVGAWLESTRHFLREVGLGDHVIDELIAGFNDEMQNARELSSVYRTIWVQRK